MSRVSYFRSSVPVGASSRQYVNYHVGSEEPKVNERHGGEYYPKGGMSVEHTPVRYTPTFSNESAHSTGLSEEYFQHLNAENDEAYERGYSVPHRPFQNYLEASHDVHYALRNNAPESHTDEMRRREETALKRFSSSPSANPQTLFVEHPATTEITGAFFDPSMRVHAPTMASLIHQDFGTPITASHDLSEHSSRFVKKAQDMGLPVEGHPYNPTAEVTNDLTFEDMGDNAPLSQRTHISTFIPLNKVPDTEVQSARKNLKQMMRGKKAHMSPQFQSVEHPKLPGIE